MTEKNTITQRQINIPDYTEGTHIAAEYGCRFPDGRVEWNTFTDYSNTPWGYGGLIPGSDQPYNTTAVERWGKTLRRKADAANIDPAEYVEAHTFIKRTVILVTTAPEEL
jgi:hypothetical protein